MSHDPVRVALTTPYVQTLLRVKARQVTRRAEFRGTDPRDIEQDLLIHVLQQAGKYDPSRSCVNTFISRVVDSAIAMMIRSRKRLKRAGERHTVSLDSPVEGEPGRTSMTELVDESDLRRRYGGAPLADLERADLAGDVSEVLASLPADLQRVVELLGELSHAAIARELGISRRQVRKAIRSIREHFEAAGLADS